MRGKLRNSIRLKSNQIFCSEKLRDNGDINRVWDDIRENIDISVKWSIGYCKAKHHKPWFHVK
jgi:hypothetical protein